MDLVNLVVGAFSGAVWGASGVLKNGGSVDWRYFLRSVTIGVAVGVAAALTGKTASFNTFDLLIAEPALVGFWNQVSRIIEGFLDKKNISLKLFSR